MVKCTERASHSRNTLACFCLDYVLHVGRGRVTISIQVCAKVRHRLPAQSGSSLASQAGRSTRDCVCKRMPPRVARSAGVNNSPHPHDGGVLKARHEGSSDQQSHDQTGVLPLVLYRGGLKFIFSINFNYILDSSHGNNATFSS